MINPADYFVPIRYLKVISPLRKYNERFAYVHNDIKNNSILSGEIEQFNHVKRKTKSRESQENLYTTTKNEETGDVSLWVDFNKMAPYVTEVHLFYKLEYFQCSAQITNETIGLDKEDDETVANKSRKETGGIPSRLLQ